MTRTEQQERIDEITFNMFVDCHLSTTETARQMGISRSTVKTRVRRHSLRSTRRDHS